MPTRVDDRTQVLLVSLKTEAQLLKSWMARRFSPGCHGWRQTNFIPPQTSNSNGWARANTSNPPAGKNQKQPRMKRHPFQSAKTPSRGSPQHPPASELCSWGRSGPLIKLDSWPLPSGPIVTIRSLSTMALESLVPKASHTDIT